MANGRALTHDHSTGRVWVVRYERLHRADAKRAPSSQLERDFLDALDEWPYDTSEDPSFFSARKLGGLLTWGICRPDLRWIVRRGDTIVFISDEPSAAGDRIYRFAAFATVATTVSQRAIWNEPELAVYRRYLNLLLEPDRESEPEQNGEIDAFVHRERHPTGDHPDWRKRLLPRPGGRITRPPYDFSNGDSATTRDAAKPPMRIPLAPNYVLFEPDSPSTVMIPDPPVVAIRRTSDSGIAERWYEDARSQALHGLTLGRRINQCRAGLRSSWTGHQHAPLRLRDPAPRWREHAWVLVSELGLLDARREDSDSSH